MRWILLSLLLALPCRAQLVWDQKELDFHPSAEEKEQVAEFKFHNAGNLPVTILSVKTSCDCTTATPSKTVYGPGEKGSISAKFDFGARMGMQEKEITVQTDDGYEAVVKLKMRIDVPKLLLMSPSFMTWMQGDELWPKTIFIRVLYPTPIHVVKVTTDNPKMEGELHTIKAGREYLYVMTPHDTETTMKAIVKIETDFPKKNPRMFYAFAQIRRNGPTNFSPLPFPLQQPQSTPPLGTPASPVAPPGR